jgi:hypothetical protein
MCSGEDKPAYHKCIDAIRREVANLRVAFPSIKKEEKLKKYCNVLK